MVGSADSLGDVRVCPGCLLASDLITGLAAVCRECWERRERWQGGGPLRYVELGGDHYHEDPRCPGLDRAFQLATSEDVTYSRHEQCRTCRSYNLFGTFGVHLADSGEDEEVSDAA